MLISNIYIKLMLILKVTKSLKFAFIKDLGQS